MVADEAVKDLASELGIAVETPYRRRRPGADRRGSAAGAKRFEAAPLQQARRRIKELEAELKVVKRAGALFEDDGADPKGGSRLSEG
jgi:transposase-like protein